jgi:hypothetical protein
MITTQTLVYERHEEELLNIAKILELLVLNQRDAAILRLVERQDALLSSQQPKLKPFNPVECLR